MISFPLYFLAIPFAILFLVWLFFSFFSFFHIAKFGHLNKSTYFATVFFLGLTIIALYISFTFMVKIDWLYQIQIDFQF